MQRQIHAVCVLHATRVVTNRFQLVIEVDACDGSVLMPMHVCPLLVAVASDVEERSVYDPVFVLFLVQREHSSWRLICS